MISSAALCHGVPQGSVPGSILLALYKLLFGRIVKLLLSVLQDGIRGIKNWMLNNYLSVNIVPDNCVST